MFSRLLMIKCFTNNSFRYISTYQVLDLKVHFDSLLPKGIKRSFLYIAIFLDSCTVEGKERIAIALHIRWWESLPFVQINLQTIACLFLIIVLNRFMSRRGIRVKVYSGSNITSYFLRFQKFKRAINIELIYFGVFMTRTRYNSARLDTYETHSLILLLTLTEVYDHIWNLLNIFRELNLFVLENFHEFAYSLSDLMLL